MAGQVVGGDEAAGVSWVVMTCISLGWPIAWHDQGDMPNAAAVRAWACAQTGVYQPRCGLRNVFMSWGAQEYLYLVLVLNNTALPPEALFMLRFAKFQALVRPGAGCCIIQILHPWPTFPCVWPEGR